jgi:heme/copper-type cytochrome/quinol oxidase subunit 2
MDNQSVSPQPDIPNTYNGFRNEPQPIVSGKPIYITRPPDIPLPPYSPTQVEPDIPGSRIYNGQPAKAATRSITTPSDSLLSRVKKSYSVEDEISSNDYGPANDDYEEPIGNKKMNYIIASVIALLVIVILGFLSHKALGNNRPKGTCAQPEGSMCVIAVTNTIPSYLVFFYNASTIATKGRIVYLVSTAAADNNTKFWVEELGNNNASCNLGNTIKFSFRADYNDQPSVYNGCYSTNLKDYQGVVTKNGINYQLNLSSNNSISNFQALSIIETVHIN